jgi:hypothetical protein
MIRYRRRYNYVAFIKLKRRSHGVTVQTEATIFKVIFSEISQKHMRGGSIEGRYEFTRDHEDGNVY